jgi:ribonuclease HI
LILGLEAARKLKIQHLIVYGDVELIVKQVRQEYKGKHPECDPIKIVHGI